MTTGLSAPSPALSGRSHRRQGHRNFERDFLTDILPLIESRYRVRTDPNGRAIAGLSMGGFYSVEIGLNHPETFAWIGVFSAGLRKDFAPRLF